MTPIEESQESETRRAFRESIGSLRYARGSFVTTQAAAGPSDNEPIHPGFLLHSILGKGLREQGCTRRPRCQGTCCEPEGCAYGRLFEPRPAPGSSPLAGQRRATVPCLVRAPWTGTASAPMRFSIILLGRHAALASSITSAIEVGLVGGIGRRRVSHRLVSVAWEQASLAAAAAAQELTLRIATPVRILRKKKERRHLRIEDIVRDILFRTSAWAHHHQGLPWISPPPFLLADTKAAIVDVAQDRFVTFHRYSGSQRRRLRLGGLLGTIALRNVSRELGLLLSAGTICGTGKGASIGLGQLDLIEVAAR